VTRDERGSPDGTGPADTGPTDTASGTATAGSRPGAGPGPRREAPAGRLTGRFWTFWACLTAGSTADGMTLVALSWAAATLTDDALTIAVVAMAERLPWLVLALPLGAVVDRLPRLALMAGSGAARALAMALLGLLLLAGDVPVPLLVGFALFFGVTEVLSGVAGESAVPLLAARDALTRANGHVRAGQILAGDFAGRPLGGLLLKAGLAVPFLGNALLNGAGALLLHRLRRSTGDPRPASAARASLREEATAGARVVWRDPLLRVLALSAVVLNTLYAAMLATQVLFARESLGLDALGYALLLAAAALGGVLGSQYARRAVERLGSVPALLTSLAVMTVCFLGVGVTGAVPVVAVLYAVASGAVALWSVTSLTVRQTSAPDGLLGRVNATFRMVTFGVSAVGMLLGGALVDLVARHVPQETALRVPYLLSGACYLLLLAVLVVKLRSVVPATRMRKEDAHAEDGPRGR
jgi:hypothetical protein